MRNRVVARLDKQNDQGKKTLSATKEYLAFYNHFPSWMIYRDKYHKHL